MKIMPFIPLEELQQEAAEIRKRLGITSPAESVKKRTPEQEARIKECAEKLKKLSSEDLKEMRKRWEEESGKF